MLLINKFNTTNLLKVIGASMVICLKRGANGLHMSNCHPIISCFMKIQNGLPFWCWLTKVVLENRQLNGCCVVVVIWEQAASLQVFHGGEFNVTPTCINGWPIGMLVRSMWGNPNVSSHLELCSASGGKIPVLSPKIVPSRKGSNI